MFEYVIQYVMGDEYQSHDCRIIYIRDQIIKTIEDNIFYYAYD